MDQHNEDIENAIREIVEQKKYSPKDWIASRTDIPEIYLFAGDKDEQMSPDCSERIYLEVKNHKIESIRPKAFKQIFAGEGHTMSRQTKEDIAVVLKGKILFKQL